MAEGPRVGDRIERLEIDDAWLVDPASGREGRGSLMVEAGHIVAVDWARGRAGRPQPGVLVVPALVDLHAHFREPGFEDAETVATGMAAAAHGGFGTVCVMPNTKPAIDSAAVLDQVGALGRASGTPLRLLAYGAVTVSRAGETLAPLGELADAGAVGFSDDGSPVADPAIFRNALAYAGALRRPIVEHAEDSAMTKGAEANEGLAATILGLKGWSAAAEEGAVARDLAILADVARSLPADAAPRLHLTHVSTAGALELVRRAKAAELPVTCDVTPHHIALHDGWVGGDRRFSWEADDAPWTGGPVDGRPYDTSTRVNPPLRTPADSLALLAGLVDGTVDAIATDHAPHRQVDKQVEYGDAANGISGIETAMSLVLAAVAAGRLPLATAIRALTIGPLAVLGAGPGRGRRRPPGGLVPGLVEGVPANLVMIDRDDAWTVEPEALRSKGKNSPLLGRRLPGRVLATLVDGRLAYADPVFEGLG